MQDNSERLLADRGGCNRHGIPILAADDRPTTFKGHAPFPRPIARKVAVTCARLRQMERDLTGGAA